MNQDDMKRYYQLVSKKNKETYEQKIERVGLFVSLRERLTINPTNLMKTLRYTQEQIRTRTLPCIACRTPISYVNKTMCFICSDCAQELIVWKNKRVNSSCYGYILYMNNYPVYVGMTSNPRRRAQEHYSTKVFDEMKIVKTGSRQKVSQWEKKEIAKHLPPLNAELYRPDGSRYIYLVELKQILAEAEKMQP